LSDESEQYKKKILDEEKAASAKSEFVSVDSCNYYNKGLGNQPKPPRNYRATNEFQTTAGFVDYEELLICK
jgi:hypothetical protein